MKTSDFHYELPEALIAQTPLPERSASRLLVVPSGDGAMLNSQICDLPYWLQAGDLLVFNDTRVIPARIFGQKATGGRVEFLIERILTGNQAWAQIGVSKSPKMGARINLDVGGSAEVLERDEGFYRLQFNLPVAATAQDLQTWLLEVGQLPLPPYIHRTPGQEDAQRYQTVFAKEYGAVAAPTAGLHFDEALLEQLRQHGIEMGRLTLHVGAGTFQPVRVDNVNQHRMHSEWLQVEPELVEKIRATRARGGRVIAVGTTVVRALESAMQNGVLHPYRGETRIFIYPGYQIRSVDVLLTNFHLPESTLLMLVSAFAGKSRVFEAYEHAVRAQYRFFSYGDAMLLFPTNQAHV